MKIAVMGMGVAGSYLVSRLKNDHEVVGFERMDDDQCVGIEGYYESKFLRLAGKFSGYSGPLFETSKYDLFFVAFVCNFGCCSFR